MRGTVRNMTLLQPPSGNYGMDLGEVAHVRAMQKHFAGLALKCPSGPCDGFLTEYEQISYNPFKGFIMCPKCESRLRVYQNTKE
jgi:hypothetical protein